VNKEEGAGLSPGAFSFDAVWSAASHAVPAPTKSNARSALLISLAPGIWHLVPGIWYLTPVLLLSHMESCNVSYGKTIGEVVTDKLDVKQGTLALMILTTLEGLGPLHGYGIARRIEETSKHRLVLNYGTLYPALLKLEQAGYIKPEWKASENNRRAKFYALTAAGRRQLARERKEWNETADLLAAFLSPRPEAG
jgi:transcriptional regulator